MRIKPAGYGNMFASFDVLHGVEDAAGTQWRQYDLIVRRRKAQEAERTKREAAVQRLLDLASRLSD